LSVRAGGEAVSWGRHKGGVIEPSRCRRSWARAPSRWSCRRASSERPGALIDRRRRGRKQRATARILSFERITRSFSFWDCLYVAASCGHLGRLEEAKAAIDHYHSLQPALPLFEHALQEPFKNKADLDHLLEGLRKAGLPN
jgi:hypothetical protein